MKRGVNGLPLGDHQKCSTSKFCTTNIRKTQTCMSWERSRNCVNAPRGSLFWRRWQPGYWSHIREIWYGDVS